MDIKPFFVSIFGALSGCILLAAPAFSVPVTGQGSWETTLLARDINNDNVVDAYYDALQNITWLADANYAITSGYDTDGHMNLADAYLWIDSLNTTNYLGVNRWRLPIAYDTGSPGCDYSNSGGTDCGYFVDTAFSELAHLHHIALGNGSGELGSACGDPYGCLENTGPFHNFYEGLINTNDDPFVLDTVSYWASTVPDFPAPANGSFYYIFSGGMQLDGWAGNENRVWAVMDGDIAATAVPVPAAVWLFGSALAGLGWLRRKQAI